MKSQYLFLIVSLFVVSLKVSAEKPVSVLVADYSIDTSMYDLSGRYNDFIIILYHICEGPLANASYIRAVRRRKIVTNLTYIHIQENWEL